MALAYIYKKIIVKTDMTKFAYNFLGQKWWYLVFIVIFLKFKNN